MPQMHVLPDTSILNLKLWLEQYCHPNFYSIYINKPGLRGISHTETDRDYTYIWPISSFLLLYYLTVVLNIYYIWSKSNNIVSSLLTYVIGESEWLLFNVKWVSYISMMMSALY